MKVTIATRKSQLALWQAEFVKAELLKLDKGLEVELLPLSTRGDKILDVPLAKIGGKGLFLKELENAMLEGKADIAVHSMKDVPMAFPEGLQLTAICKRENPCDAFVSNTYESFSDLPKGATVGTSSLRRVAQLAHVRPDLNFVSLRGNVNTRLRKLDEGEFDAIILAAAGLIRLGFEDRIKEALDTGLSLPAGGQGAVGIESRSDASELNALLAKLGDKPTYDCVMAERAINTRLNGGCQVPIAAYAELVDNTLKIRGLVAAVDGSQMLRANIAGQPDNAWKLGEQVAEDLLAQGAQALLDAVEIDASGN
jgi:hydroxymethylbilane synthase